MFPLIDHFNFPLNASWPLVNSQSANHFNPVRTIVGTVFVVVLAMLLSIVSARPVFTALSHVCSKRSFGSVCHLMPSISFCIISNALSVIRFWYSGAALDLITSSICLSAVLSAYNLPTLLAYDIIEASHPWTRYGSYSGQACFFVSGLYDSALSSAESFASCDKRSASSIVSAFITLQPGNTTSIPPADSTPAFPARSAASRVVTWCIYQVSVLRYSGRIPSFCDACVISDCIEAIFDW